ncbi:MAG: CatA-like O-acetyltransferase [Oscillospiraceae bacterium]|nr:CatA-like O-acetyltransferase [Oscillospiraceae bacterium]
MKFTPIDLQTWPRGQMFYYFSKMAPTGYSMTVHVDVTELRKTLREAGKFYGEGDRILMPFSITCHHAATDGYHVNSFLESLQQDMNAFSQFL